MTQTMLGKKLHCLFYFYLGDLVSKGITYNDFFKLYNLYNWLMHKSITLNDKYGLDVWGNVEDE